MGAVVVNVRHRADASAVRCAGDPAKQGADCSATCLVSVRERAVTSVLTHEATINSLWLDTIRPVLIKRFPGANEEQLIKGSGDGP